MEPDEYFKINNYTLRGLDTQMFRGWEGLANSFVGLEIQRNRWKE